MKKKPSRPFIYLAGPITKPNPMHNTNKAIILANQLTEWGFLLHVPHLTVLWDMITPKDWEEWMAIDFEIILRCDGLYRMRGESKGADAEVQFALDNDIRVFHDVREILKWKEGEWNK